MPTLDVLTGLSVFDERDFSVKQTQFKQPDSSCAPTKRPDILENMNIYDAKGAPQVDRDTHIPKPRALSCLQAQRTASRADKSAGKSSRLQMASSVDERLSIGRTLQADSAPPDDFRGPPEDNFRFTVAHTDRGLFEARKEGYLRRPANGPLRSTEGRLRPTEDRRQADGALKSTEKALPGYCHFNVI